MSIALLMRRKKIIEGLKRAGAVSPETAIELWNHKKN